MKAFVAGSTGQTGQRIVKELLSRNIPVRALVRDLEPAKKILPPETELVVGDVLNSEGLKGAIGNSTVLLCATGARPSFDPTGPYQVDYLGTKNLVDAAKAKGIEHFVLVTSLCVSQFFHPLNLFWLILYWKKQAEIYLTNSGLTYTIVRPGGLNNEDNRDSLVMSSADTLFEGRIPREQVAQVCVESLFYPESRNKILEIVTNSEATPKSWQELFARIA
ncbi:SDR family oxidoreductase [Gloeothece verrucosa]|uniref:NAD-dependent epimerase/dehydratase n=1 Tax=Gloeothece verrucosa (strain PCC 7822) TaxID=497965 RepID=E0UB37_GLOV7|nr:SDR family oxidoreductase [Gloeothece verrucosa]ADN16282.1 NAD-dependent epimerase/dehydratase [Gloeothece verrucosa PCC 7822]